MGAPAPRLLFWDARTAGLPPRCWAGGAMAAHTLALARRESKSHGRDIVLGAATLSGQCRLRASSGGEDQRAGWCHPVSDQHEEASRHSPRPQAARWQLRAAVFFAFCYEITCAHNTSTLKYRPALLTCSIACHKRSCCGTCGAVSGCSSALREHRSFPACRPLAESSLGCRRRVAALRSAAGFARAAASDALSQRVPGGVCLRGLPPGCSGRAAGVPAGAPPGTPAPGARAARFAP